MFMPLRLTLSQTVIWKKDVARHGRVARDSLCPPLWCQPAVPPPGAGARAPWLQGTSAHCPPLSSQTCASSSQISHQSPQSSPVRVILVQDLQEDSLRHLLVGGGAGQTLQVVRLVLADNNPHDVVVHQVGLALARPCDGDGGTVRHDGDSRVTSPLVVVGDCQSVQSGRAWHSAGVTPCGGDLADLLVRVTAALLASPPHSQPRLRLSLLLGLAARNRRDGVASSPWWGGGRLWCGLWVRVGSDGDQPLLPRLLLEGERLADPVRAPPVRHSRHTGSSVTVTPHLRHGGTQVGPELAGLYTMLYDMTWHASV